MNDKDASDSDEELMATAERDFECLARSPTDHFEKLLKVTCPNHMFPVKHKLKECSMRKNYMAMGSLARAEKPEGDSGGKAVLPFPLWSCHSMADQPPMSHVASLNSSTR
jgi:hypothetical protein